MKPYIAFAALAAIAPHAFAQQSTRPHPADPAAKAPPVRYESVFSGYTPCREEKIAPWRDLNDEAARVGGHVGIFGGAGHAGHAAGAKSAPSKPVTGQPAAGKSKEPAGQPPARSAPQAPQGGHQGH